MKLFCPLIVSAFLCMAFVDGTALEIDPKLIEGKWAYYDAFYNNVRDSGYIMELSQTILVLRADGTCEYAFIRTDSTLGTIKTGTYSVDANQNLLFEKYPGEKKSRATIKQLTSTTLVLEYTSITRKFGTTTLTYYLRKIK